MLHLLAAGAVAGCGEDVREVQLLVGGAQFHEQVEDLVQGSVRVATVAVDLVHDNNWLQVQLESFLQDKSCLGHGAVERVDHKQNAVNRGEHPFDLAAEVGVSWRVHDVDEVPFVGNRGVLRKDRDATFAFEVIVVHHAFGDFLVFAEGASLAKKLVDKGCLPMVDVRDDGDVSEGLGHGRGDRVEEEKAFDYNGFQDFRGAPPGPAPPDGGRPANDVSLPSHCFRPHFFHC